MDSNSKRKLVPPSPPPAERRRIGTIVHDDRGNASVSWRDAPADSERPVLELLGDSRLTLKNEESCDPYARVTTRKSSAGGARTDLRKLSEWIKMMRELESRKKSGDGDEPA